MLPCLSNKKLSSVEHILCARYTACVPLFTPQNHSVGKMLLYPFYRCGNEGSEWPKSQNEEVLKAKREHPKSPFKTPRKQNKPENPAGLAAV